MLTTRIGCEVHAELKTATKLFCSCENAFGGEENSRCCPVCTGMPGSMPMLNARAVELAITAGLSLHSHIPEISRFDRKNYFYPDLPKAWQTTQYFAPICVGGYLDIVSNGEKKRVRINRIQLEEDAGKLVHDGEVSRVDFNRCGVPLIEIVTEPDMTSAEDVVAFLTELKSLLEYTGVSDGKMQEGSLRCDVNLSVGHGALGTRTETKNLNSFRAVRRAVEYEAERQKAIISGGGTVECETLRFDEKVGKSFRMRKKERAADYRFFSEPDLLPVAINRDMIKNIEARMPETRGKRIARYIAIGLPRYDAEVLTAEKRFSDLYDETMALGADYKRASNFIMSEVMRLAKTGDIGVSAAAVNDIIGMMSSGKLNNLAAKSLLAAVWGSGENPTEKARELKLVNDCDENAIKNIVRKVVADNPNQTEQFIGGAEKLRGYFVGLVMRISCGRVDPVIINRLLDELIRDGKI